MQNILNALLNTIFVSIPEETIWLTLCLIFLKRFDLLDWRMIKENMKWLAIPVLPTVILINIFRYIIIIPRPVMTLSTLIIFCLLTVYIVKKTDLLCSINSFKIVLCFLLSTLIIIIPESLYLPIIVNVLNIPIDVINQNIFYNILFSIIARVIQITIIVILLNKKYDLIKYIVGDKKLIFGLSVFCFFTSTLWGVMLWIFTNYVLVEKLAFSIKFMIYAFTILLPAVIYIFGLFIFIYFTKKLNQIERYHSNMLDDIDIIK